MSVRRFILGALLCVAALPGCSNVDEPRASGLEPLAQMSTATDAGAAVTATGPLSGSAAAAKCGYYTRTDAGCNGYYCGVTEAQIAAAMPADSVCGDVVDTCKGTLVDRVSECTRNVVIANLGTPAAQLRSKIEECVYSDAATKERVKPACLGCFLDSASCVVDNCLFDCSTDGPGCDTCRMKNNCVQPVFSCAKVPSPL